METPEIEESKPSPDITSEAKINANDRANARHRDISINVSDHSSWLSKNIAPIIALLLVLGVLSFFFVLMIAKNQPTKTVDRDILLFVAGGMLTLLGNVVQYYFGGAHGSVKVS